MVSFGCVPNAFWPGLLVPILKKPTLDPSAPSSYSPITQPVVFSKLLEMLILDECIDYPFSSAQFGFVQHHRTNTATALAHDIFMFAKNRGSTVYCCSLDVEGAFDAIPHGLLFHNASDAITDHSWLVLYRWYSCMSVHLRWEGDLGTPIRVEHGTRQGGLSFPLLFKVFFKDLIDSLNGLTWGITINRQLYNALCYADDILLASLTPSSLQSLINTAAHIIQTIGLKFDPAKSSCMMFGHKPFSTFLSWMLEGCPLHLDDSLSYLSTSLADDKGNLQVATRTESAYKAFYSLQSAGLHPGGCSPDVSVHIFLLLGCRPFFFL